MMEKGVNGILLSDKGVGETSHGVVKKVRALFREGGPVKVGHAGTLDPFATGLLIILVGEGTKLSRFIMSEDKVYLATVELGIETDTLDPTGRILRTSRVPNLEHDFIRARAGRFVGKIRQVPPAYSALRHEGTRAYKLARKGLDVALRAREVTIHALDIVEIDLPLIFMRIRCSSGTYIRSLAADLGRDLGPGGHLRELRRIKSGPFDVENAISSSEMGDKACGEIISKRVISLPDALPHMEEIFIDRALARRIRQGYQPSWKELTAAQEGKIAMHHGPHGGWIKLVGNGKLAAIIRVFLGEETNEIRAKVERVFSA